MIPRICRTPLCGLLLGVLAAFAGRALAEDPAKFIRSYCVGCHGPLKQEGDRRFDQLTETTSSIDEMELWQDLLDQISLGEMPPPEARQPLPGERAAIATAITAMLASASDTLSPGNSATVMRRLNRFEYDRSVRKLLRLPEILVDPTDRFPPDEVDHHFSNIGSSLVLSDFLLTRYIEAAGQYLSAAIHPARQPPSRVWRFQAPFCPTGNRHDGQDRPGQYQNVRKNYHDVGGFLWIKKFSEGVPHAGNYRVRVRAAAMGRDYPYPESLIKVPKADPLRMEVVAGAARYGELDTNNTSDRLLAEFELVGDQSEWYEFTAWLDAGFQPRIAFPNGPLSVKAVRSRLVQNYPERFRGYIDGHVPLYNKMHPEFDPANKDRLIDEFFAQQRQLAAAGKRVAQFGISHSINTRTAWSRFFSEYEGPRIRVYQIEIEGPFYAEWPPASHRLLLGDDPEARLDAPQLVRRFAESAFRRPVDDEAIKTLLSLYEHEVKQGVSAKDAVLAAYQSILCSPQFLYLHQTEGVLDCYDVASRLSYLLWSAPPDAELLGAARDGLLDDRETVAQQVNRLLDDSRSNAFVKQFVDSWLGLSKLGKMLPSQQAHPEYFIENLEKAMRRETRLFVADAIRHDRPVNDFIAGRHTFINGPLARLYGIEGVSGHEFQRVHLVCEERGGLLGMASVLTATANGIETSPVVRGVWTLESLLGTPPSSPPPDVEPIEPDIRGAQSIREQLAKHRDVETCNVCHRKIDPYGFALESFDEIGRFRTHYRVTQARGSRKRLPIDVSGELPTGETFHDVAGLRKLLADRDGQFLRNLTGKLLTYATGRFPTVKDRIAVDRLVADRQAANVGFRQLIHEVVASQAFRE